MHAHSRDRIVSDLDRGDFVRLCYRLGHHKATGVLSLCLDNGKSELLILRRGQVFARSNDGLGRETARRLERLVSAARRAEFDGGLAAYPPSLGKPFSLVDWARSHLERQIDSTRAQVLAGELAGVRLAVVEEYLPAPDKLDATDQRIINAMRTPRRLDQIWPIARTPRFRLLSFIHFLRSIGAIKEHGVAARRYPRVGSPARHQAALRALGLAPHASRDDLKRAYRRLARKLHPDLHTGKSQVQRKELERQLATVNHAYRELLQQLSA